MQILPGFSQNLKRKDSRNLATFQPTAILPSRHRGNRGYDRRRDHFVVHGTVESEREGQEDRHQGDGGEEFHVQRTTANRSVLQVAKPISR